jgi:hypothetical protein
MINCRQVKYSIEGWQQYHRAISIEKMLYIVLPEYIGVIFSETADESSLRLQEYKFSSKRCIPAISSSPKSLKTYTT